MVVKARKSEEQVPIDWVIYLDVGLRPAGIIIPSNSCFQAGASSLWSGHRSSVDSLMLPAMIDGLTVMALHLQQLILSLAKMFAPSRSGRLS
jgi:hypothetical protein